MIVLKELPTWAARSKFKYAGSVAEGTRLHYGTGNFTVFISALEWTKLLDHFGGRTVNIGTSRTDPPRGSVGEWLKEKVTKTAIASYVGPILIEEGYAEKGEGPEIRFKK